MEPETELVVEDIARAVEAQVKPVVQDWSMESLQGNEFAVSLTVAPAGQQPHDAGCVPALRSQFAGQMVELARQTGIGLRVLPDSAHASVTTVIGNVVDQREQALELPLDQWWKELTGRYNNELDQQDRNLGPPHYSISHILSGLYQRHSHLLTYGHVLIDWNSSDLKADWHQRTMNCRTNFTRDFVWLSTLGFEAEFDESLRIEIGAIKKRAGRNSIKDFLRGLTVANEIEDLYRANLFCWMLRGAKAERGEIKKCSEWLAVAISTKARPQ